MVRTHSRAGLFVIGAAKAIISETVVSSYAMFVSPGSILTQSSPGSATSSICEAYPSNGDEPYTYAWTKKSGDNITINYPSSKLTTFSASGSNGDLLSAIFECEVVDNSLNSLIDEVQVVFIFGNQF